MRAVNCDYCGKTARFVTGEKIYPHRSDLYNLQFYLCEECNAYVGCHKNSNGKPLGRLANAELRKMKSAAHAAFDPIWKNGKISRNEAYKLLAKSLKIDREKCHIGMFDIETCREVIAWCEDFK